MPNPTIHHLRTVNDLAEDQIALPEPDMTYVVEPLYTGGTELPVTQVIRRGDHLFAVSVAGVERCIAGDGATFQIRGRFVERKQR